MSSYPALHDAWDLHGRWSTVANEQQRRVVVRRAIKLALLLAAALAGGVAALVNDPVWVSTVAGMGASLCLAASAFVQQRGLGADVIRRWTLGRVASETLKSECYRALAGAPPYAGADASARMRLRIDQVQNSMGEHLLAFQQTVPETDRPLPSISGLEDYVERRARDQADWHRVKIGSHNSKARRLSLAEIAVTLGGAVLAAGGAIFDRSTLGIIVGIVTTIAAALGVHREATRHDRVAASYARTAEQLDRLIAALADSVDAVDPGATAARAARFVTDVEEVLARQVEGWVDLIPQEPSV